MWFSTHSFRPTFPSRRAPQRDQNPKPNQIQEKINEKRDFFQVLKDWSIQLLVHFSPSWDQFHPSPGPTFSSCPTQTSRSWIWIPTFCLQGLQEQVLLLFSPVPFYTLPVSQQIPLHSSPLQTKQSQLFPSFRGGRVCRTSDRPCCSPLDLFQLALASLGMPCPGHSGSS